MPNRDKTHYVIIDDKEVNKRRKVYLRYDQYKVFAEVVRDKEETIYIAPLDKFVKRSAILEYGELRRYEQEEDPSQKYVLCNDRNQRFKWEDSSNHTRECLRIRNEQWMKDNPKKAEKWKKICEAVFKVRDEKRAKGEEITRTEMFNLLYDNYKKI